MLSEADLIAKRAALRWLAQQHPEWTHQDLADALSMSHSWESRVAPAAPPGAEGTPKTECLSSEKNLCLVVPLWA